MCIRMNLYIRSPRVGIVTPSALHYKKIPSAGTVGSLVMPFDLSQLQVVREIETSGN